LYVFFY